MSVASVSKRKETVAVHGTKKQLARSVLGVGERVLSSRRDPDAGKKIY